MANISPAAAAAKAAYIDAAGSLEAAISFEETCLSAGRDLYPAADTVEYWEALSDDLEIWRRESAEVDAELLRGGP